MTYRVEIAPAAKRQIKKLTKPIQDQSGKPGSRRRLVKIRTARQSLTGR